MANDIRTMGMTTQRRGGIHRSPHGRVDVPARGLARAIVDRLDSDPQRVAIIDQDRPITAGRLATAIRASAGELRRRGLGKGDVICVTGANSAEWLVTALGALASGLTFTTASPLMPLPLVVERLRATRTRLLATTGALREWSDTVRQATGADELVYDDAFALPSSSDDITEVDPESTAVLLSSSGTSGMPKSVMVSHRALVSSGYLIERAFDLTLSEQRALLAIPIFHAGGLTVALSYLQLGGTVVLQSQFEPVAFAQAIERHRITFSIIVPPMARALARHPITTQVDTSSLSMVVCTAAPLSASDQEELAGRLGCYVGQGYAMTEGLPFSLSRPGDPAGSVGAVVPNSEVRIVDPDTGRDVGIGEVGEFWLRGPQLMSGYLDDAEATASTLDEDGWLHSGDLCTIDAHGIITVVDRLKELIKTNGMQVPPAVLEEILSTHDDVADCAVVGRRHEKAGEVPVGYVVAAPGGSVDVEGILSFVERRVPPHMRLYDVVIVDEIPRNPTGKPLRRVLRERERSRPRRRFTS